MKMAQICGNTFINQTIRQPKIPLKCKLETLNVGDLIICKGEIPDKAKRFEVNLLRDIGEGKTRDTFLGLKVNAEKQVVRAGATIDGKQAKDVRATDVKKLRAGRNFTCLILIKQHHFKVSFNSRHLFDFKHESSPSGIDTLSIDGTVSITHFTVQKAVATPETQALLAHPKIPLIPYFGAGDSVAESGNDKNGGDDDDADLTDVQRALKQRQLSLKKHQSIIVDHILEYNPETPFQRTIKRGLRPGSSLYFSARPAPHCKEFNIGFKEGQGISNGSKEFAFLLRFGYEKAVRCGQCKGDSWDKTSMRIVWRKSLVKIGEHFDLIIRCEATEFHVMVNSHHLLTLQHDLSNLAVLKMLSVTGHIQLVHVRLQY